uniref:C2H2-type domain-containing protein n=1 Tax=Oncorhynchus kisutch TaxID=8019 RepID=A0A8C7N9Y4_ONCKI
MLLRNEVFQTQLCTIMDIFVESAVREVSRLLDECFVAVMENEENSLLKREMTRVNKTNTRKFASFMEVLSKTSIEKIALLTYVVESEVRVVEKIALNRPLRLAGGRTEEKPQRSEYVTYFANGGYVPSTIEGAHSDSEGSVSESNHHDDQPDFVPLSSPASDEDLLPQFHPQDEFDLEPQSMFATDQDKRDRQPFSCSHCGKDFKMRCLLNKHFRTHSKPYSCLQCGRCFSLKRRLEEHSMTHSGETPFSCADCDAVFRQKPALQSHMKRHKTKKTVTCTVCEKKFLGETGLERHKCSGDAPKTFSCSLCPKTFKWRRRLVDHEATHSGERKYLLLFPFNLSVHRSSLEKNAQYQMIKSLKVMGELGERNGPLLTNWYRARYSGAKKYLVSHQLCKFSHLKRLERPVIFIIGTLQL